MKSRNWRIVKKEYLDLFADGGRFYYQACIQVRILRLFWVTVKTIEDWNREYTENRAEECLGYVCRNEEKDIE